MAIQLGLNITISGTYVNMWIESASDIYIILFGKLSFLPIFHYFHNYFFYINVAFFCSLYGFSTLEAFLKREGNLLQPVWLFSMKETAWPSVISSSTRNLQSVMSVDIHGPAELPIVKECQKN